MPRLFTGLELPEDIKDELSQLDMPIGGARWIDFDDYHLTLRFAGDVDHRTARDFAAYLEDIDADAFPLQIKGVGVFTEKEPRTLFASVAPSVHLDSLARAHERAARHAGLPPSARPFRPHVTLARLKVPPVERVARFLEKNGRFACEPFLVTHFSLFSARPGSGGGPYVIEETFPLLGGLSRARGLAGA